MTDSIQPIGNNIRLIKPDGTATDFFIRWAKQRQIDIASGITAAEAQQLIDDWAAARDITVGTGLSGGGNLSADVNIGLGPALLAYAGGDTPSAFTVSIVDSVDAAAWRAAIGAGTSTVTPAALTKTDDTNVTLVLGGTPATALLQATSLTLGWTGTLSVARGGTGAATAATARTSLGLAIGSDVQAFSAKLSAYAGGDTPSAFTLGIVDSVDAAAWRAAIGAGTSTVTPAAVTKTDDTNVTLTLGGTPATAALQAFSMTLGWTGQLSVARGGTGAATAATARTNLGFASGIYMPTVTSTNNVSAYTFHTSQYIMVGNQVFVSGVAEITPTSTGLSTNLGFTLPIASNISSAFDLLGTVTSNSGASLSGGISGDPSAHGTNLNFYASVGGLNYFYFYTFAYTVI